MLRNSTAVQTGSVPGPLRAPALRRVGLLLAILGVTACALGTSPPQAPTAAPSPAPVTPIVRQLEGAGWRTLTSRGLPAAVPSAATSDPSQSPSWESDAHSAACSLLPAASGGYTLSVTAPDAVPLWFSLSPLTGAYPISPVVPLVPRAAAAADEVLVAGIALDPRGLPLALGHVSLTSPFGAPGRAERLELDAWGCFVWRTRVGAPAPPEGIAMLKASGWTPGGWTVETPGVTQVLLGPGRAVALVLQGIPAVPSRPPRWQWAAPVLTVTLEDRLERSDEVVLERAAPEASRIHPDRLGENLGELRFTLPPETTFEQASWRLNILGQSVALN